MGYANQEFYIRKEDVIKDAEHPYAKLSVEAVSKAMNELKGYEFQLYILLSMNQIDYKMGFSPTDLVKYYGGSDKSWRSARDALKKKGYLVQISGNQWEFKEEPMRDNSPVLNDTDAEAVFAQGHWDF